MQPALRTDAGCRSVARGDHAPKSHFGLARYGLVRVVAVPTRPPRAGPALVVADMNGAVLTAARKHVIPKFAESE